MSFQTSHRSNKIRYKHCDGPPSILNSLIVSYRVHVNGRQQRAGGPAGSREQRPRNSAGCCKSNRFQFPPQCTPSPLPSLSLLRPPFLSPDLTHFGRREREAEGEIGGRPLPKARETAARGEGGRADADADGRTR
jgi:hypothetical protein